MTEEQREKYREKRRAYYRRNKEKFAEYGRRQRKKNPESNKQRCKQYRKDNLEKSRKKEIAYYRKNREKILDRRKRIYSEKKKRGALKPQVLTESQRLRKCLVQKKYYQNNKKRYLEYHYKRMESDLQYRIRWLVRSNVKARLKTFKKAGPRTLDLIGCDIETLKAHIESLFQTGMSWGNWGMWGWHLDHKIPLSKFDLTDPEQLKKACHYSNLQPLWAKDNLRKNDSLDWKPCNGN